MRDRETGSHWNHITGECVHGQLSGASLATDVLYQMTAAQAVERFPEVLYAVPEIGRLQRTVGWFQARFIKSDGRSFIPPYFRPTMGQKDSRLDELAIGLGVWNESISRFYPRTAIVAQGHALIDELDGRLYIVFVDPQTTSLAAVYIDAGGFEWSGTDLLLDDGCLIRDGWFFDTEGARHRSEEPAQLFSRWFGFSYTFPDCDIFESRKNEYERKQESCGNHR